MSRIFSISFAVGTSSLMISVLLLHIFYIADTMYICSCGCNLFLLIHILHFLQEKSNVLLLLILNLYQDDEDDLVH